MAGWRYGSANDRWDDLWVIGVLLTSVALPILVILELVSNESAQIVVLGLFGIQLVKYVIKAIVTGRWT